MNRLEERLEEAVAARKSALGTEAWINAYARERVLRKRLLEAHEGPYRYKHGWIPIGPTNPATSVFKKDDPVKFAGAPGYRYVGPDPDDPSKVKIQSQRTLGNRRVSATDPALEIDHYQQSVDAVNAGAAGGVRGGASSRHYLKDDYRDEYKRLTGFDHKYKKAPYRVVTDAGYGEGQQVDEGGATTLDNAKKLLKKFTYQEGRKIVGPPE